MSDRPDLDGAIRIAQEGGLKITGGKYAPNGVSLSDKTPHPSLQHLKRELRDTLGQFLDTYVDNQWESMPKETDKAVDALFHSFTQWVLELPEMQDELVDTFSSNSGKSIEPMFRNQLRTALRKRLGQ